MAKNLRRKLPSDDTLVVQDINKDASRKFADELKAFQVVVADTAREVAEKSVCVIFSCLPIVRSFLMISFS
jgi:3-hydroxyisobutyrate dehydrogenase